MLNKHIHLYTINVYLHVSVLGKVTLSVSIVFWFELEAEFLSELYF